MPGQHLTLPSRVVFCCTANRIRSVFAARAATQLRLTPTWLAAAPILSRGILAEPDRAAMPIAITVAARLGIDLKGHASHMLTQADLQNAWLIGMTKEHLAQTTDAWRVNRLGDFEATGDIADPIGLAESAYFTAFAAILAGLQAWSRLPSP